MDKIDMRSFVLIQIQKSRLIGRYKGTSFCKNNTSIWIYRRLSPISSVFSYI